MSVQDGELKVMQDLVRLLEPVDAAARKRILAWASARFEGGAQDDGQEKYADVAEFIAHKHPPTATARLAALVYWVQVIRGKPSASIKELNDLNRDAGGRKFSEAASVGQSAIAVKRYVIRSEPGHLQLTPTGARLIRDLPSTSPDAPSSGHRA